MNYAFAMIARGNTKTEEKLVLLTINNLLKFQVPIFITSAGPREFTELLKNQNSRAEIFEVKSGLADQMKDAISQAGKIGPVLYLEGDKEQFSSQLNNYLSEALDKIKRSDLVLFSRSKKAFQTFPGFQRTTEGGFNNVLSELIGQKVDYTYGPRLISQKLAQEINQAPKEIWGWGILGWLVGRAGKNCQAVEGNFTCPNAQRFENDIKSRKHRLDQIVDQYLGFKLGFRI